MEYVQERITTLHDFSDPSPPMPDDVTVVVPLRVVDAPGEVVLRTFETLADNAPTRVIVPVRGDRDSVNRTAASLRTLYADIDVVWCNAPDVKQLLKDAGMPTDGGKGLDTWLALGIASEPDGTIVIHDGDNLAFNQDLVPRLAWGVDRGFPFAKGYYARIEENRLYGRLMRLLCRPLVEAVRRRSDDDLPEYLAAFRYPLAGEFAMDASIADRLEISPTWGLEIDVLCGAFELAGFSGSAQTDLGIHRHHHRDVQGEGGLGDMAAAVTRSLLLGLTDRGHQIEVECLQDRYLQTANEYIEQFAADAAFNGLEYDESNERAQVARYAESITAPLRDDRLTTFRKSGLCAECIWKAATVD